MKPMFKEIIKTLFWPFGKDEVLDKKCWCGLTPNEHPYNYQHEIKIIEKGRVIIKRHFCLIANKFFDERVTKIKKYKTKDNQYE